MTELDEYWQNFLIQTNRNSEDKCSGDLHFEASGFVGNELLSLVLTGKKTAFFSTFASFSIDEQILPVSGELYLILDKNEKPCCVIELESVQIVPYNEVTWEMAKLEGEDANLASWKEKHDEYLTEEASILGFNFTPDIKLVFQKFRVVYK